MKRLFRRSSWIYVLAIVVLFGFAGMDTGLCGNTDNDPHMTGLPELTHVELEWQNKHMIRVKKVNLNKIGLRRVNAARLQKGLEPLTQAVAKGEEIEGTVAGLPLAGETTDSTQAQSPGEVLPAYVDNSMLPYFPPIRTQGSFPSCGVFSGTYYAMTYMHALANELDAKNGGNAFHMSPKWTYNMVNGGELVGTWYYWAYEIGQKHGCASYAEFPYVGSTSDTANYRQWCLDPAVWRNAIDKRFDQYGYVADTHLDAGIQQVKELLVNGYILNIPTYIYSWNWKYIDDDPATSADDPFVGKNCAYWVNGTQGYHAMTVVGYNDDIWVDVNSDGVVDAGEKGAFRIANSWGSGWGESGFCWMAYDALKNPSAVPGGPSAGRIYGWSPTRAHWVTARNGYQPTMVAEFTLNHLERSQLRMTLGISDTSQATPSTNWYPEMIYFQGGPYAFDGSGTAVDGTFVFDFSDIAPSAGSVSRYYLGMYDNAGGSPAELVSYKLIDVLNGGIETVCYDVPQVGDASQVYAAVDYVYDDGNQPPVAVAAADVFSGQAPLTVIFDAGGSYDPDGAIASYSWDFGDGESGAGAVVSHTYTSAGNFTAALTVADDKGAVDTDTVGIAVSAAPPKAVFVSDISMALISRGKNTAAEATVTVVDEDGAPVAGATVSGSFSGIVSGSVSGVTAGGGSAVLASDNTKSAGTFTFKVEGVSAGGYIYDPSLNAASSGSISNGGAANQKPVADAGPDQSVLPGETVSFDGSGSYDPDGAIVSYEWNFGDGAAGSGETAAHTFGAVGSYTVTLTVTDSDGATDADTAVVTVSDGTVKTMYVSEIAMYPTYKGANGEANAEVTILDENGSPVANATVSGRWSGLVSGSVVGETDANGKVTFLSAKTKSAGQVTFTVTNVTASGLVYDDSISSTTASMNL